MRSPPLPRPTGALNRFTPEGGGRLALSLDRAAYPALIAWLVELAGGTGPSGAESLP